MIEDELVLKELYSNLINDEDFDRLELGLNQPNIFEILRISKTEIRHSNFLSWLLNPKGSHGIGEVFLKKNKIMSEKDIWNGNPSQWINFSSYLLWLLPFGWLGLGIVISLWKYLTVKTWKFRITNERIIDEKGVLSRVTNELELFRVKDITLQQPFWLRLVGLSNIQMITSDRSNPLFIIPGVKNGKKLREELRSVIDKRRTEKGVIERDFD